MIVTLAVGFLLGGIGSVPIAGAVSVFVCRRGLAGYPRHGLALAAGAALAEGTWCLLVLVGADRIFARWPIAVTVAQIAGGCLLLALGVFILTRHVTTPALAADGERLDRRLRDDFQLGATLSGLNLVIPVNWLALSSLVLSFGLRPQSQPVAFAAGVSLGIVTWYAFLLRMIFRLRHRLPTTFLARLPRVFGVLLLVGGTFTLGRAWF
jgi:threonine/homoserine/homoserine lactone efflux protein